MPRPTVSTYTPGSSFAPSDRRTAPSLEVNAPLNVNAGVSGAEQVAHALGLVAKAVTPMLMDKIQKEGFDKTRAGQADATLNTVDAAREKADDLYARGVKSVTKERAVRDAIASIDQTISETGGTMSPPELSAERDRLLKEKLSDFADDPESAGIAAKLVGSWQIQRRAQDNDALLKQTEQTTVDSARQNVLDSIRDGSFNYADQVAKLTPVIGREAAVEEIVDAVGATALAQKDESIIARWLPESVGEGVPGPRSSLKHSERLDKYAHAAKAARESDESVAKELTRAHIETGFIDRLARQHWLTKSELIEQQKVGLLTEGEVVGWYSRSESTRLAEESRVDAEKTLADNGLPIFYLGGLSDSDREELVQRRVDAESQRNGGDAIAAAIAVARRDGFADKRISTALTNVPTADAKAFGEAAKHYRTVPPDLRSKFVTSEARRVEFDHFNALVAAGASPEVAAKEIAEFDADKAILNRGRYAQELNEAKGSLDHIELSEKEGLFDRTPRTLGSLANAPYARQIISDKVALYVDRGMPPSEAVAAATKEVISTHDFVRAGEGRNLLVPRTEHTPPNFGEALSYAYARLPEYLAAEGVQVDPAGVRFSYSPTGDSTRMILVDSFGIPLSTKSYKLEAIYQSWIEGSNADAHAARQALQAREQLRREQLKNVPSYR